MDAEENLKQQLVKVVTEFADEYMGVMPKSVEVDIHQHCVLATLQSIMPQVEKDYVKGKQSCELLDEFYSNIFNTKKRTLQNAIGSILGQLIGGSMLWVEAESGDGVIMFTFPD